MSEEIKTEVNYAGFWIRLFAHVLDSIILTIVSFVLQGVAMALMYVPMYIYLKSQGETPPDFMNAFNAFWLQVLNAGLYAIAAFPYFVYGHLKYGTTLGKKLFKIYVRDSKTLMPVTFKQSTIRFCSYLASYLPMGAGFLMCIFQPEKRALHDLIAGTVSVVEKKPN